MKKISEKYMEEGVTAQTEVVDSRLDKEKQQQDNSYFSICKKELPKRSKDIRKKLVIPFGIDDNTLVYCDFEKNNFASYIMGAAGSGKSVLLDDIIIGIMMNYHPDEVELWLVDFMKTGFSKYAKKCPPHIKNVILGKSDEMIFGVIDNLYQLMEKRKDVFSKNDWNDISDIPVNVYMPVIFVIIDEFAEMSQVISETKGSILEKDYVVRLENLLREGRKLGFKFIFASQSFSNGMNGLSQAAKDQIQMRMALKNSVSEINDTLDLTPVQRNDIIDNYVATLPPYKTLVKTYLADSNDNYTVQVNRISNLKIDFGEIDSYMAEINEVFRASAYSENLSDYDYVYKNPFVFMGNIPKTYISQVEIFDKYENEELINDDEYDEDDVILYPGTSQGYGGIKNILLHRDACENMIMAGGEMAAVSNTILAFVEECSRKNIKVTLWTDSRNLIYRKHLKDKIKIDNTCVGVDEICADISRINDMNSSEYSEDELIIMLGIRNIYDAFALCDEDAHKPSVSSKNKVGGADEGFEELLNAWNQVISDPSKREDINQELSIKTEVLDKRSARKDLENQVYDAREDITMLLKWASKRGKHFAIYYGNISDYKALRPDMRLYKHKLLYAMDKEFQYEFNEHGLAKMEPMELFYQGNNIRYKANVFISKEIPIAGYHVDEEGKVVN